MSEIPQNEKVVRSRLLTSILLVLLALVAITAATVAWFSIADKAKVKTMSLDIIGDLDLKMDLDAHSTIDQYKKTLSFTDIAARIQQEKGFSMKEVPLDPVTTSDAKTFIFENGSTASDTSGSYLEFTLHFMAEKDMLVHLTSADSSDGTDDGTAIVSQNAALPQAMRISFTADGQTWIYDPGMTDTASQSGDAKTFGLPASSSMKLTENNAMFSLKEGVDKAVLVHVWLEGTDEACTDDLKEAEYAIRLRFTGEDTGTDQENG